LLIIRLNGGPGCSSLTGLFVENGPFQLRNNNNGWFLEENPHSWHKLPAYVLYIDQPVGTGLSYTTDDEYCSNDQEVNDDLYAFLQNFLKVHADIFVDQQSNSLNRKLWFSGESMAGHYIPSFVSHVLHKTDNNLDDGEGGIKINIGGAAIGNGWTDPYYQYSPSMVAYSKGVIDLSQWAHLNSIEDQCRLALSQGKHNNDVCFQLLQDVISSSSGSDETVKMSYYDTRVWDDPDKKYPPGINIVEAYLGNPDASISPPLHQDIPQLVLEAIHATGTIKEANQYFEECTDPPYYALQNQEGKGVVRELTHILDHKDNIPILFFNGMDDLICNHVGNEIFLNELSWEHSKTWTTSKRYAWKLSSDSSNPVGYVKSHHNLSFLKIKGAGHMVPMDQPEVAFEMMKIFLNDPSQGFLKHEQTLRQGRVPLNVGRCSKEEGVSFSKTRNDRVGRKQLRKKRYFSWH